MSDWMRVLDFPALAAFLVICAAWAGGGWLLGSAALPLRQGERLLAGAAAGWLLYLAGLNLLAHWLAPAAAGALAAGLVLTGGLLAARQARLTWRSLRPDLHDWPQILALLALALLFESAQRGVSIFDEYLHLPLVSTMGAGNIPPNLYINPHLPFAYHYGLQVFAAALESAVHFYPWAAWDLARGLAIALTLMLAWLWLRRAGHGGLVAVFGGLLAVFAGGTRWLMLLLPGSALHWISAGVQMSLTGKDTAATLVEALTLPWIFEGGAKMPFPFAYHNGVFVPVSFTLGSSGALPFVIVLLLLLIARPFPTLRRPFALAVITLILASLALSAEHLFVFLWLSAGFYTLVALVRARKNRATPPQVYGWLVALAASALLALLQGGYISVSAGNILARLAGQSVIDTSNVYGFAFRWPPGIVTAHFATLSLADLRQVAALLFELGPALLLAPLATRLAWRAGKRGDGLVGSLGLAALLMIVFTLFIEYGVDRSSTRFTGSSLWLWIVLVLPLLGWGWVRLRSIEKGILGLGSGAVLLGGVVLFAIQLSGIPAPQPGYFIQPLDVTMTRQYWNTLEHGAQVLSDQPERAVTVFGRASTAGSSIYFRLPEWQALVADPLPDKAARAGYSYIYIDNTWWDSLKPATRAALNGECVRQVAEKREGGQFRRLLDIRACGR